MNLPSERIDVRRKHIGSSEIAALFGESSYCTKFELWHRKNGTLPEPDLSANPRVFWGSILEPAIAQGVALLNGWKVRKVHRYIAHPRIKGMGASIDFEVIAHEKGAGVLEIKNVDRSVFRRWEDGRPPLGFDLQLQHQLACAGRSWGAIAALVGGNDPKIFEYQRHDGAIAKIEAAVRDFWISIQVGEAPEPDFNADLDAIRTLYRDAVPGSQLDMRGHTQLEALCEDYRGALDAESAATRSKDAAKASILHIIRTAEEVSCSGYRIVAKTRPATTVEAFVRKAYRDFRLYKKEEPNGS